MNGVHKLRTALLMMCVGCCIHIAHRSIAAEPPAFAALLPPPVDRQIDFVADVQPIFRQHCFECHAAGNEEGGLNLGIKARVLEGGESGAVLVAGDSAASRLIHLVAGAEPDAVMPPEKERLSQEQIGVLRAWIDQGAAWPANADVLDPRTERAREHWAFQPLSAVEVPAVQQSDWALTPIDRFVLAKLEASHLPPAPPLDNRRLIRRVYFDLLGLPPTPEEMRKWEEEARKTESGMPNSEDSATSFRFPPSAFRVLVDHLLESQHYGERWARHWLDVARYADSNGQEGDQDRPNAYHYRDFVIRALNDDLPFDTFVRWQLAGDEFEPSNPQAIAATGFLTAGPHTVLEDTFLEEERLRNRYNELDDMLATIGTGLLGITVGCARCHDHKYDAVSAREYYRMLAAFHGGDRREVPLPGDGSGEALAFRDFGSEPRATWLFGRGDFYDRDQLVQLGFLSVLSRERTAEGYWEVARQERPLADSTYQRKAMALWMTDVEHGAGALVARVIVNRVWQHHFGEGLVRTVSDFGVRAEPPSHPELLEWLAHDFVEHGWKLKRLHQLIVTSATYGMGNAEFGVRNEGDLALPSSTLLWRRTPRRLEAEVVRDALLAVSGQLNTEPYGPAFKPPISSEAIVARNLKTPYPNDIQDGPENHRRTVYMFHKRVIPYPLLQAFDRPDSLQSCGRRENTTVAPQALALLNDEFVRARAMDFAQRLLESGTGKAEGGSEIQDMVTEAFRLALAREPSATERSVSTEFIRSQTERRQQRDQSQPADEIQRQAWADFCQSLFGLNEFVYVD